MAIKSSDQISIVDITDAYSVILTSDGYTFPGTVNAAKAGSCTTQIIAIVLLLLNNFPFRFIGLPMDKVAEVVAVVFTIWSGVDYIVKNRQVLREKE